MHSNAYDEHLKKAAVTGYCLSLGKTYHSISPSESDDTNIDFTIYSRNNPDFEHVSRLCHFTLDRSRFVTETARFQKDCAREWDQVDQRILGHRI